MKDNNTVKNFSWNKKMEKYLIQNFWHCVGHIKDIPKNNDFFKTKFFNLELITHNSKDIFWTFENKCPHRGSKFFKKCKGNSAIVCPYHAWTFTPNKVFIPRKETFKMIDENENIFPDKWQTINFYGFLFISKFPLFTLEEQLGRNVSQQLENIGNSIEKLHSVQEINFHSNWKISIENALEPYHVDKIHKNTLANLERDDGENKLYEWTSVLTHKISSKRVNKTSKLIKKLLKANANKEGYWSLYIFPFAMVSTTEGLTFAHQFYQPLNEKETLCITKLWCRESIKKEYNENLNIFYDSVSNMNLKIFKEDAEICSYIPNESWALNSLKYYSDLEKKIIHFRKCLKKFLTITSNTNNE